MSDVVIGALTLQLRADETQLRAALEKYRALGNQGVNVKVVTDAAGAQAGLKAVTDAANQAGAAGKQAGASIGQGNKEAEQTAANYAKTLGLNMRLEQRRASEYRAGIQLNSRLAADATRQQSALEAEAAKNYRATMSLNLQLAGQRAAAEKAAASQSVSAAQQAAQAFTAGAERTKQALDGIKLAYSQARATFDKDDGAARNWQQNRDAALAYQRSVQGVSTALNGLKTSGEATVGQLRQIADMEARLAREQNTLSGGINRLGISGNFSNALNGAQQLSMFMPGLIGQSVGAAAAFQNIASTSGTMGVALGAAGLAVYALGKAFTSTSEAFGSFQQGLQGISSIDTSLSGVDMQSIADGLQKLSTELPVTTEQLTNMARGAVQMGITGKEGIMEFTNSIALLAVATRDNNKSLGDTGQLANELGVFLNETGSTARTYTDDLKGVVATLAAVDKVTPGTIQSTLSLARYMASGSVVLNLNKESIIGLSGALSGLGARAEAGGSAVIRVLMAMNRAAGGTKEEMAGLEGVAGITKDELANVFQGSVTVKANAFASVMGVTSEQFKTLVKTSPAQAFQLLAEGLARAHAAGIDMTAAMDAMGIKNVRDIRLIDQLTVGHGNLKVALDASTDSAKNQADLQDRVSKATQNSVDRTTELKNAWTATVQSFGQANAPAYNFLLTFLGNAAKGAKEWADNLRGVSQELTSWSKMAGIDLNVLSPETAARVQQLVSDMRAMSQASGGQMTPTMLAKYMADAKELEQIRLKTVTAQGSGAVNAAGPLRPGQTRGTYAGQPAPASGTIVEGDDVRRLLGLPGLRTGTPYGHKYFGNQVHNGEDVFAPTGAPLEAPFASYITTRWSKTTGHIVELMDAQGQKLLLGHLDRYAPELEARIAAAGGKLLVKQGELLGYVGQTGSLAHADLGPGNSHVHYMAYDAQGKIVNPNTLPFRGVTDTPITANPNIKPGSTGGAPGPTEAELRAAGQKIFDAYYIDGDHSKKVVDALRAFRKAHADIWQGIMADGADAKKKMKALGLTDDEWAKYKARAMELVALQEKRASGKLTESQSLDAKQAIDSFNSDPVKAKAFQFATEQVNSAKARAAEQKRIDDQTAADWRARAQEAGRSIEEIQRVEKEAAANQLAAEQALADGKSALAKTSAQRVITAYDTEVQKAGSSASAKLLVEQAWQAKRLQALNTISRAEAQADVTNLEQQRNKLMNAEGVTKAQRQALWAQYAERISAVDTGLTATLANNQTKVTTGVKQAQAEQAQVVQANAAKAAASLAEVLANPDQYRDGARGLTTPLQVGLKELMAQLPKTDAEAQRYIATLEEMQQQGLVSASSVAAVKAQVASMGVEARVAAGEFDHIADGASEGLKTVHYSLTDLEAAFPANASEAGGFSAALDELYTAGSITNEMLLTMKARLDALRESQSFESGLVLENARNGAFDNITDGSRGLNGSNNATLAGSDQNKPYLNLDLIRDATNALNEADFDAFLKGAGLAQEDIDSLTASWKAFNEQINRTLDDINAHPEQYADGARGLPSTGGKGKTLADAQREQADAQRLQSIQDSRNMAGLESQHTLKLVSEEAYINKREALQKVAALHAFSDSVANGETYKVAAAQLQADLTKIEQDGIAARAQLAATNDQKLSTKAATSTETFISAQKTLSDAYRTLGQAAGETVSPNQALIDQLTSLYTVTGISKDELTALIAKLKELDQQTKDKASLDTFISGVQALGSTISGMGGSADLFGKSLSAIGTGVQVFGQAQKAITDTKTAFGAGGSLLDKLGAAGEWGAIASTVLNVIGGIGDAIMNLSPAFQAWKKGLLEVADAEKQAMGSKSYGGNSILNPYYEALKKDSDALTSKANAGFWQRVGWALFGGAPETLDKAQSDALTKAGTIFNDFAGSLYGAMESALMSAFDSGNFDGVAAAVEKSLNQLVAKMYLQTLIAKSKIGDDLKMLADDQSAGKDITADLARLKADVNGVTQQYEAGSAALPGFGAGAADGSSGSSGTMFGQGAQAIEFSLPSVVYEGFSGFDQSVTLFSSTINAADAMYRRVEAMYTRVEAAFERGFGIDINLAQGTQSLQASIPTGPLR